MLVHRAARSVSRLDPSRGWMGLDPTRVGLDPIQSNEREPVDPSIDFPSTCQPNEGLDPIRDRFTFVQSEWWDQSEFLPLIYEFEVCTAYLLIFASFTPLPTYVTYVTLLPYLLTLLTLLTYLLTLVTYLLTHSLTHLLTYVPTYLRYVTLRYVTLLTYLRYVTYLLTHVRA